MESKNKVELNPPYGGRLIDLLVEGAEREDLARRAGEGATLQLSPRAMCDLELLATGGFSPLDRFMGKADYDSVLDHMRLANGLLWSIPITLPVAQMRITDTFHGPGSFPPSGGFLTCRGRLGAVSQVTVGHIGPAS